jgi:hypothetical protein
VKPCSILNFSAVRLLILGPSCCLVEDVGAGRSSREVREEATAAVLANLVMVGLGTWVPKYGWASDVFWRQDLGMGQRYVGAPESPWCLV